MLTGMDASLSYNDDEHIESVSLIVWRNLPQKNLLICLFTAHFQIAVSRISIPGNFKEC